MQKQDIIFTQDAPINSTKTRGRGTAKNNLLLCITAFKYSINHIGVAGIHIPSEIKKEVPAYDMIPRGLVAFFCPQPFSYQPNYFCWEWVSKSKSKLYCLHLVLCPAPGKESSEISPVSICSSRFYSTGRSVLFIIDAAFMRKKTPNYYSQGTVAKLAKPGFPWVSVYCFHSELQLSLFSYRGVIYLVSHVDSLMFHKD